MELLFIVGIAGAIVYLLTREKPAASSGAVVTPPSASNPIQAIPSGGQAEIQSAESNAIGGAIKGAETGAGLGVAGGVAGVGAGAAGASVSSVAVLSVETAGIAAAVALAAIAVGNLLKCGTITTIGCTKMADANSTEEFVGFARVISYHYLSGTIDLKTCLNALAQLDSEARDGFQRVSDYANPAPGANWMSGEFTSYSAAARQRINQPNIPDTSPAAWWFVGMTGNDHSLQWLLEKGFPLAVQTPTNGNWFFGGSMEAAKDNYDKYGHTY